MTRILITGMSGTGKSTVVEELIERGIRAVDLDQPEWSEYRSLDEDADEPEWLWRDDLVEELLANDNDRNLVVSGCAANQGRYYPRFDQVVLLTASEAVTVRRLATRVGNDFGKAPDELAKVLADKAQFEPLLRAGADVVIDTDEPLDRVVERIAGLLDA